MTTPHTPGRFVWRELYTRDVEAAKRFYAGMFGWTPTDRPMGPDWSYTLWTLGGKEIGGMMDVANLPQGDQMEPHWLVYVSVEDVEAAAARAQEAGGQVLMGHDMPGIGRAALIEDPQGARLMVFRSATGDPEDGLPGRHDFCWESLSSPDPQGAREFYTRVVGWGTAPMHEGETTLFTWQHGGEERMAASMGAAPDGSPSAWSPFVAVPNLEAAATMCRQLGGEVLLERMPIPDIGAFGVIADPSGATLFLLEALPATSPPA